MWASRPFFLGQHQKWYFMRGTEYRKRRQNDLAFFLEYGKVHMGNAYI